MAAPAQMPTREQIEDEAWDYVLVNYPDEALRAARALYGFLRRVATITPAQFTVSPRQIMHPDERIMRGIADYVQHLEAENAALRAQIPAPPAQDFQMGQVEAGNQEAQASNTNLTDQNTSMREVNDGQSMGQGHSDHQDEMEHDGQPMGQGYSDHQDEMPHGETHDGAGSGGMDQ